MNKKSLAAKFLSLSILTYQSLCPTYVLAQSAPATSTPRNLNLASQTANVTATHAGVITVGGVATNVVKGQLITPAESVALSQIVHTGTQSLVVGSLGTATGGTFNLSYAASHGAATLSIPSGVTAIDNIAKLANLSVSQNLVNSGTLQVLSTSSSASTGTISALNISNQASGVISSVLPASGVSGFVSAITSPVHLNINAAQNFSNAGVIASSGNLTVSAPQIVNALSAGATGATPSMTAAANLNLVTNNLTNAGLITARQDININNASASSLIINAAGGTFNAANGNINILTQNVTDPLAMQITGGDFVSQTLNLNTGTAPFTASINSASGIVALTGGNITFDVATGTTNMGNINSTGGVNIDPYSITLTSEVKTACCLNIYSSGDLYISAPLTVNPLNGMITLAGGNIYVNAPITAHAGWVTVSALGNIYDAGSIDVSGVSGTITNGCGTVNETNASYGGNISMFAGQGLNSSFGLVTVNGNLNANGIGSGRGGSIGLYGMSNGSQGGTIVNGNVTANAGPTGTQAGFILVSPNYLNSLSLPSKGPNTWSCNDNHQWQHHGK